MSGPAQIMSHCQNRLYELSQLTIEQLQQFDGIGAAKACSIVTALELGKRFISEERTKRQKIRRFHRYISTQSRRQKYQLCSFSNTNGY